MSAIYDNWERLVAATLKREEWRESALASSPETSFSSSLADDASYLSHTYSFNSALGDIPPPVGTARGFAGRAARLFTAVPWFRRKNRQEQDHPVEEDPDFPHPGLFKRFSLKELQAATDYFSTRNIFRRGAFGKFYKGRLMDGSQVLVRSQLWEWEFQTEIEIMGMAVHKNLLRPRGYCMTQEERMLVFPFMANGSLASCLKPPEYQPPLNWPTRKQIALGAARGLACLHHHCNPKIIHRDVKAANIFLDEGFEAVVSYFGLAQHIDDEETPVEICRTIGHLAPEYLLAGIFSVKTDVYSYGITLLELISGQGGFDLAFLAKHNGVMLVDWVSGLVKDKKLESLVDGNLAGNYIYSEVEQLIQLALLCTQWSPIGRPDMSEVIMMLEGEGLEERWEEWRRKEELPRNNHWIIEESDIEEDTLSEPR